MSSEVPKPRSSAPRKLPKLPNHAQIQKRPLLHPSIASHRGGAHLQKVVYLSAQAPFISTVKRVRKYLDAIDKRAMGKIDLLGPGKDKEKIQQTGRGRGDGIIAEEVLVKATGRAIEKALQIALHFQGQSDCIVRLRTGSVGAIDDIVCKEGGQNEDQEDLPASRVRRTSMLEVAISLR